MISSNVVNLFDTESANEPIIDESYKVTQLLSIPNDRNMAGFIEILQCLVALSTSGSCIIEVKDDRITIRIRHDSEFDETDEVDLFNCLEIGSSFTLNDLQTENLKKLKTTIKQLDVKDALISKE